MSEQAAAEPASKYGKARLTRELTDDQRGWAKDRNEAHYRTNGARWYIDPTKPSVPIPAVTETNTPKRRRRHA